MKEKNVVVCANVAVGEVCSVHVFASEQKARELVESDILKCTTEPFTKKGNPMWSAEDIDRTDRNCYKAADEFEYRFVSEQELEGHRVIELN